MKPRITTSLLLHLLFLAAIFFLVACPTTDEPNHVLNMKIDKDNDSLLTFDSLIVKVYSKDSTFSQIVFHGKLTDPKQVLGLQLDPRVGKEFKVSIIGYKGGKVGVNKEITILANNTIQSKNLPVQTGKDTTLIDPTIPEIIAPSDTSVAEGDSLLFRVSIRNPLSGATTLTLKITIPGAVFNTIGPNPIDGYFTWRPSLTQGQIDPYFVTFVYASADRKVERTISVKVLNTNQAPKLKAIQDQKIDEDATLTFKVEATDPDADSLTLTAAGLPAGATFSSGTFSWKPTVGQAGNYSVKFKVSDGRDSDLVATLVTVGNVAVPPALTVKITSPIHDTTVNITPITILYTVNGTPLQKKFPLKDGKNRIRIDTTVQNRAGFDTILITLDTLPPSPPSVHGNTPTNNRTPAWTWATGGGGLGTYRYRLDTEDMASSIMTKATAFTPATDLAVGTHTLFVQEKDEAGNWSVSGSHAIRIDTARPVPPEVSVNPGSPTNNTRPVWSWKGVGEDLSGLFRYKLDSKDFANGTTETRNLSLQSALDMPLAEGPHTLYVQQQSAAGNWSPSTAVSLSIDLTPPGQPRVTLVQPSPTNSSRPTWSISSGEGGAGFFRTKLDDTNLTQGTKSGAFASYTPDSVLAHGPHTLYVQEKDAAGNWSPTQSSAVTVDLMAPGAPVFDTLPLSPLNSYQPEWIWKSAGEGSGTYRIKLADADFSRGADTLAISRFKPTKNLSEGSHPLYVQERDMAGNWSPTASKEIHVALRGMVGKAGFSAGEAAYIGIAQSPSGELFTAFKDEAIGGWATVMKFNAGAWVEVGKPGFSVGQVAYLSLALGSSGNSFVAYQDISNGRMATVMRFNGSFWENVGTSGFSLGTADYVSLALNTKDTAYVAFMDGASQSKATVMRYNGRYWENVGPSGFTAGEATYTFLAMSSAGIPYVAFNDGANASKITVMRWAGDKWTIVGTAGFSAGGADYISLVFNKTGEPYVAYNDNANSGKATVMKFNGKSWEPVGTAGFSAGYVIYPTLALTPAGMPYVAYQDAANENKATVMRFNGKSWQAVGREGFTAGRTSDISLTVNKSGVPYVAYKDGENGNKISVMQTSFDP